MCGYKKDKKKKRKKKEHYLALLSFSFIPLTCGVQHWKILIIHTTMANKDKKMSSFKSNENIHKKEDGSYYVVSANKASSVTL